MQELTPFVPHDFWQASQCIRDGNAIIFMGNPPHSDIAILRISSSIGLPAVEVINIVRGLDTLVITLQRCDLIQVYTCPYTWEWSGKYTPRTDVPSLSGTYMACAGPRVMSCSNYCTILAVVNDKGSYLHIVRDGHTTNIDDAPFDGVILAGRVVGYMPTCIIQTATGLHIYERYTYGWLSICHVSSGADLTNYHTTGRVGSVPVGISKILTTLC